RDAGERLELRGIVRGVETAHHAEVALDPLRTHEVTDERERALPFLQEFEGTLLSVPSRQRGEGRLDAGGDLAAVAGAAAESGVLRVEDGGVAARGRGHVRRVEARVPGGLVRVVALGRTRRGRQGGARDAFPPPWRAFGPGECGFGGHAASPRTRS